MSTLVSVSNGPVDPFSKIMQAFNVTAELQSSKLVDQCDICHNSYMDMIRVLIYVIFYFYFLVLWKN